MENDGWCTPKPVNGDRIHLRMALNTENTLTPEADDDIAESYHWYESREPDWERIFSDALKRSLANLLFRFHSFSAKRPQRCSRTGGLTTSETSVFF